MKVKYRANIEYYSSDDEDYWNKDMAADSVNELIGYAPIYDWFEKYKKEYNESSEDKLAIKELIDAYVDNKYIYIDAEVEDGLKEEELLTELKYFTSDFISEVIQDADVLMSGTVSHDGWNYSTGSYQDYTTNEEWEGTVGVSSAVKNGKIMEKEAKKLKSDNLDKTLVKEGELMFTKEGTIKTLTMTPDGMVEYYVNGKLEETKPFSKLNIERDTKMIMQEGFKLTEVSDAEVEANEDYYKAKIQLVTNFMNDVGISPDTLFDNKDIISDQLEKYDLEMIARAPFLLNIGVKNEHGGVTELGKIYWNNVGIWSCSWDPFILKPVNEAKEVEFNLYNTDSNTFMKKDEVPSYWGYVADKDLDLDKLPDDVEYTLTYELPKCGSKLFLTNRQLTDEERKEFKIRLNSSELTSEELKELFEPKTKKEEAEEQVDLAQTEQELKDNIEKVDQLQGLKDELNDKLGQLLGENKVEETRVNRVLHKGDKFINPNGVECEIISVDEENLLDGEPQVTYKIGKDFKCYKQSSVNAMLDQNQYKLEESPEKIPGAEVKKTKEITSEMPTSTLTSKKLSKQEILDMNQIPVNEKQAEYLRNLDITEEDVILGLQDLVRQMKYIKKDEPFISIEEYINEVTKF